VSEQTRANRRPGMNSAELHTLVGAYALDAVDDVERAAFGRHMAECESCAIEVAELRIAAGRLGDLATEAPPARLKSAVLAEISRTPQLTPKADGRRGASPWRRRAVAAVAAGVVAIGAGGVTYVVEDQRVRQAQQQSALVTSVLSAPDAVVRTTTVDGGTMTVVLSPSLDRGVAVASGLPSPGSGRAYQFWVIKDRPVSVGMLAAGAGNGVEVFTGVRGAQAMALSKEPAGGSAAPTDIRGQVPVT